MRLVSDALEGQRIIDSEMETHYTMSLMAINKMHCLLIASACTFLKLKNSCMSNTAVLLVWIVRNPVLERDKGFQDYFTCINTLTMFTCMR